MAKLKVFRTAIGFHDALVAAPSRRAALAAWGASADLFARGVAEEVTDPALTAEPLARPGEVIRRSRGTAAEQLAALPPDPPARQREETTEGADAPQAARSRSGGRAGGGRGAGDRPGPASAPVRPPRPPKPRGDALDAAEAALTAATDRHRAALADLADRERRLARERRDLERAQATEAVTLARERDDARAAYDAALQLWRAS